MSVCLNDKLRPVIKVIIAEPTCSPAQVIIRNMSTVLRIILLLCAAAGLLYAQTNCPDQDPELIPWSPTADETVDLFVDGEKRLLTSSFLRARSISIQNGGVLVISDQVGPIQIQVKYILIQSNGELHIGSETCRYQNNLDILLYGRSDDTDIPSNPVFGRKFIAVAPSGAISIHGAYKQSWTYLETTLSAGDLNPIIDLADDATNWFEGDRVVIASSDYDMNHAEEFTLTQCSTCGPRQVHLQGSPLYDHLGEVSTQGVDLRAEVGIVTRNIKIHGQMETACYGNNKCEYFEYDTFGGHVMVVPDFKRAEFEGIELYNMGQQILGRYPIHFHIVGSVYGSYARQLSIHHCFSRCVTLHGSEGLIVQDVVGYDTLGHCFFLEDGNEQNNQLIHNLGLVTRPGTLLPSDRDKAMCEGILTNVYPGYIPNAEQECMEVATFWIAHPNNTFRNNSAAGSVNNGFHFVFHRVPTGPSSGTLPPYHGELSHIPFFVGNKAHSNGDTGLFLDRGVKVTAASQEDPSEILSLGDYARYMPHYDRDLLKPRYPSNIVELTAYKNSNGAVLRGGDVFIQKSKFSDNDVGVILLSDGLLPEDAGSHQEITDCTIAATTDFNDAEWQARAHPSVGIQLVSGPILVDRNYFYGYRPTGGREAYAVGFYPQYKGQFCTASTLGYNTASEVTVRVYFGRSDTSSIHGAYNLDGDLNQIFYDRDGSLTGWPGAYAVRRDNYLLRGTNCYDQPTANAAVCTGDTYGQIFVNASTKTANMTIERLVAPLDSVRLTGANKEDTSRFPDTTQYQAAVIVNRDYHIYFSEQTPAWVQLSAHNFPQSSWAKVAISYGSVSGFRVTYIEWKQMENVVANSTTLTAGSSVADVDNDPNGFTYFWSAAQGLLYVKLVNHYATDGYNFCAAEGCQFIRVETL